MLRHIVSILAMLLAATALPGAEQRGPGLHVGQYQHARWSVDDGLPAPIYSMAQSKDGYLWLATRDGVFRFDGIRFEKIPADPKSNAKLGALKLLAARDGSVFVGYRQGSIAVYRNGAFHDISPTGWVST